VNVRTRPTATNKIVHRVVVALTGELSESGGSSISVGLLGTVALLGALVAVSGGLTGSESAVGPLVAVLVLVLFVGVPGGLLGSGLAAGLPVVALLLLLLLVLVLVLVLVLFVGVPEGLLGSGSGSEPPPTGGRGREGVVTVTTEDGGESPKIDAVTTRRQYWVSGDRFSRAT